MKFFSFQDLSISTTALVGILVVFIIIQVKYLFASHADFTTFNLTYSQYVRKGFFELIIATAIGIVISYVLILKSRILPHGLKRLALKTINFGLILGLLALLASAFKRNTLYIAAYQLTRTRIIGHAFLFWLAAALVLFLFLNLISKLKEKYFIFGLAILTFSVTVFFNLYNMDQAIAAALPTHIAGHQDFFYIATLSEDAVIGWEKIVTDAKPLASSLTKPDLSDQDKVQLANIKLALISLQQKRDFLDKKYAQTDYVKTKFFGSDKSLPGKILRER